MTPSDPASLPLHGVRVVEFSHMVMGPTCGLVLADLGADVVKIEPTPAGDNTRRAPGSGAGFFPAFNRNKRSLPLDLKSDAGKEIVHRLLGGADVLTENFRPGALDKLGFGFEQLRERYPRLIYCSLKGFLPGPYEHRTALDENVQMMGGLAYMTGPPGRPLRAGSSVNDIGGGVFGAVAILAALLQRERTGRGQLVRSGLFEHNMLLVAQHMMQAAVTGRPAPPMPARVAAWAIYDVFDTADGAQVFVGVVSDSQWPAFCESFGLAAEGADPELATNGQRVAARERLIPRVREVLRTYPKADLMRKLEDAGLPFAPIVRPEELFDDPHLNASGGLLEITLNDGTKTRVPALPIELDGRRPGLRRDPPRIGGQSREILRELGYDAAAIDRLVLDGTVATTDEAAP